ncbi:MAG: hypothetical protein QOE01_2772 [Actinomycetota bacterium]|nr:hypothetical protein [Actinomycetota bacterium]
MTDHPGWTSPGERPEQGPVPPGWSPQQPPPYGGTPGGWGSPAPPYPGSSPQHAWGPPPGWTPPPKPGVIPLRPLGVGEILDGAISTIRSMPKVMLGLSAVVAAVTTFFSAITTYAFLHDSSSQLFRTSPGADTGLGTQADTLTTSAVQAVLTTIAVLLLTGVLTVAMSRAVLGERIGAGEAWATFRPQAWRLVGLTLVIGLIGFGIAAVVVVPVVLAALGSATGLAVVLGVVLGIGAVVAVIYLYVVWSLAPAALILEKAGIRVALRRSRHLVTGAWWRTFGILILIRIIAGICASVLQLPFFVIMFVVAFSSGSSNDINPYTFWPLVVTSIGQIVAATVTWPFSATAIGLLYVDRRMRREALDLELTRAAGLTPSGQSATPGARPEGMPGNPSA